MLGMRIVIVALGTLIACAIAASPGAALSTNNPQWHRCEKGAAGAKFKDSSCDEAFEAGEFGVLALASGTREITGKAIGSQELTVGEAAIVCKKLSLASGAKVTGAGPEGLSGGEATIQYEECEVTGQPTCEINKGKAGKATIATKALKATEAYKTKEAAEREEAEFVTLLEPKELTEGKEVYAAVEFSGTCPISGKFKIEGQLALENLGGSAHLLELELIAPKSAIAKVFTNHEGKSTEKVVKKTKESTFSGGVGLALFNPLVWWLIHG